MTFVPPTPPPADEPSREPNVPPAQPRYGELRPPKVPMPPAGYGQPAQQQQQQQSPSQPYPQQPYPPQTYPAAPGYPAQQGYPAYAAGAPAPVRPSTLGRIAFIVSVVVFVLSIIAAALIGLSAGPLGLSAGGSAAQYTSGSGANYTAFGAEIIAHIGIGSLLGLWALVQGIIAVVTRRGRPFGVAAIVIAGVAPIISFFVYAIAAAVATR